MAVEDQAAVGLRRSLGIGSSTALIVGFVIGSTIFRVPGVVAANAGGIRAALLAWAVGGVIALCGSLSLAELGAMFPRAGGVYVFLYEAYGPAVAFLKGWVHLIVGPAAWSAAALVFADYARSFVPLTDVGARFLAAALVVILTAMGCRSLELASRVQAVLTWAKVAALIVMAAMLLLLPVGGAAPVASNAFAAAGPSGFGLALISVMFAYDGWNGFTAMAGEVRQPARIIPISLVTGVLIVVAVYLAVNLAFYVTLPAGVLQGSTHVAVDAMSRVGMRRGESLIALLVMLSIFGSLSATVIMDPRISFAMADSGLLFRSVARVHPRWQTPYVAILLEGSLAMAYVFARSFDQLAEAFILGVWPFLALAVAAVPVLRRTRPNVPRPYRTAGYPIVPIAFLLASIGMIVNLTYRHPLSTAVSLGVSLVGLPVYWAWGHSRFGRKSPTEHDLPVSTSA
jgi:APA family basic amino acid/polyamine antiporter